MLITCVDIRPQLLIASNFIFYNMKFKFTSKENKMLTEFCLFASLFHANTQVYCRKTSDTPNKNVNKLVNMEIWTKLFLKEQRKILMAI